MVSHGGRLQQLATPGLRKCQVCVRHLSSKHATYPCLSVESTAGGVGMPDPQKLVVTCSTRAEPLWEAFPPHIYRCSAVEDRLSCLLVIACTFSEALTPSSARVSYTTQVQGSSEYCGRDAVQDTNSTRGDGRRVCLLRSGTLLSMFRSFFLTTVVL